MRGGMAQWQPVLGLLNSCTEPRMEDETTIAGLMTAIASAVGWCTPCRGDSRHKFGDGRLVLHPGLGAAAQQAQDGLPLRHAATHTPPRPPPQSAAWRQSADSGPSPYLCILYRRAAPAQGSVVVGGSW